MTTKCLNTIKNKFNTRNSFPQYAAHLLVHCPFSYTFIANTQQIRIVLIKMFMFHPHINGFESEFALCFACADDEAAAAEIYTNIFLFILRINTNGDLHELCDTFRHTRIVCTLNNYNCCFHLRLNQNIFVEDDLMQIFW
jgi:hypothetical protein